MQHRMQAQVIQPQKAKGFSPLKVIAPFVLCLAQSLSAATVQGNSPKAPAITTQGTNSSKAPLSNSKPTALPRNKKASGATSQSSDSLSWRVQAGGGFIKHFNTLSPLDKEVPLSLKTVVPVYQTKGSVFSINAEGNMTAAKTKRGNVTVGGTGLALAPQFLGGNIDIGGHLFGEGIRCPKATDQAKWLWQVWGGLRLIVPSALVNFNFYIPVNEYTQSNSMIKIRPAPSASINLFGKLPGYSAIGGQLDFDFFGEGVADPSAGETNSNPNLERVFPMRLGVHWDPIPFFRVTGFGHINPGRKGIEDKMVWGLGFKCEVIYDYQLSFKDQMKFNGLGRKISVSARQRRLRNETILRRDLQNFQSTQPQSTIQIDKAEVAVDEEARIQHGLLDAFDLGPEATQTPTKLSAKFLQTTASTSWEDKNRPNPSGTTRSMPWRSVRSDEAVDLTPDASGAFAVSVKSSAPGVIMAEFFAKDAQGNVVKGTNEQIAIAVGNEDYESYRIMLDSNAMETQAIVGTPFNLPLTLNKDGALAASANKALLVKVNGNLYPQTTPPVFDQGKYTLALTQDAVGDQLVEISLGLDDEHPLQPVIRWQEAPPASQLKLDGLARWTSGLGEGVSAALPTISGLNALYYIQAKGLPLSEKANVTWTIEPNTVAKAVETNGEAEAEGGFVKTFTRLTADAATLSATYLGSEPKTISIPAATQFLKKGTAAVAATDAQALKNLVKVDDAAAFSKEHGPLSKLGTTIFGEAPSAERAASATGYTYRVHTADADITAGKSTTVQLVEAPETVTKEDKSTVQCCLHQLANASPTDTIFALIDSKKSAT